MRIDSFEIRNYKGIALAHASGLANENVVTISGRNGTGKSHVLEALAAAWNGYSMLGRSAGSWGSQTAISIEVVLTEDEWAIVDEWISSREGAPSRTDRMRMSVVAQKGDIYTDGVQHPQIFTESAAMNYLLDNSFKRQHRFALIDFVPARRLPSGGRDASVDLSILARKQIDEQREGVLSDILDHGNALSLPTAASYLMTLDYQDHLAERDGLQIEQYDQIVQIFHEATGKSIPKPRYTAEAGGAVDVELANGMRHDISGLSSGEQEMISMMYLVKRLSATGGVMLMDEPEQHLHPSLQATLFEAMKSLSLSAQVIVVTHSVNLISAAKPSGIVEVAAADGYPKNQLMRLTDHPEKIELVAKLGLTAGDYFQNDMLLVVEGKTDAKWLQELYPLHLGRAHIIVAGGCRQVLATHDTLQSLDPGVPWLCVIDRDLRTESEIAHLTERYPNLSVWQRRALETVCLEPSLLQKAMKYAGKDYDIDELTGILKNIAEPMKSEVVSVAVHDELSRQIPLAASESFSGSRVDKAKASYENKSAVYKKRADRLLDVLQDVQDSIDSRWPSEWLALVNPHNMLAAVHAKLRRYENSSALMSALISTARDTEPMPEGLEKFRERLIATLGADSQEGCTTTAPPT